MTAVGRFFPCVQLQHVHVSVQGSVYVRVPRTWFCPVFHGARHVSSTTAVGRFFPCPRRSQERGGGKDRVHACASYMVLPTFPWRASRFVHDGRRPFFSMCPITARSRVRVRVRVRPCASYVVLPSFPWRASRFVHDGRRPFFPVST